ncbi:NMT1/THI5 like protein [Roseovarius tolerans]|uniref:NMT1/THI5 like protein n=2 Tax=Roseovarius tolerans TaxID=74031 RepID=A0A0L6CVX2_9RHOB|nr:NMT1/THI5 like protein [Roseovarius tolerans]
MTDRAGQRSAGGTVSRRMLLAAPMVLAWPVFADDLPVIRAAVLKVGTVNWELQTILREGLDREHGFRLEVQPYADTAATHLAVQGGAADLAVADMIWLARQRAAGRDYVFIPYSRAVGGVVVPEDSTAQTLADLRGGKIGIAGGPLDKSWLILRAYARAEHGMDLEAETEQVFGAPPLIYKSALRADYAGAINYWHFLARMKAEGMRELISVGTAAEALGLDPATPLLGYYMREAFMAEHPGLAQAFYDASRAAKDVLGRSEAAWQALRPLIAPQSEAQFAQLRADWLAGVPPRGPVDPAGAQAMFALMHELGGRDLVGDAARLPPGLFAEIE